MLLKQKISIGCGCALIVIVLLVVTYLSCLAAEVPFGLCVLAILAMSAGMGVLIAGVWLIIKPLVE